MPNTSFDIQLNGDQRRIAQGQTITGLLEELRLGERRVAVEINQHIVPRSRHDQHKLKAGDEVEIIHAIGGG